MLNKITYAIIGAGNGGQAMAAYLSMQGNKVRLFDFFEETINPIKSKGYIELTGTIEAKGYPEIISTNIKEVLDGADVIMVVNPSIYHRKIAQTCAEYLKEDQIIFLQPGATFGAFAFSKALKDFGFDKHIPIAESSTLLFACRILEPGKVLIGGKKERLLVATLPACENQRVVDLLSDSIQEIEMCKNVLVTSIDNTNPLVHPLPTILNCSWIESGNKFLYYYDGIGKTASNLIRKMDLERIEIGKKLGLTYGEDLFDLFMQYDIEYDVRGDNLSDIFKNVDAYKDIYAGSTIKTRYIYEDVPTGLIPLVELGELLDLPVKNMKLVIDLCQSMLDEDFVNGENSRHMKNLGLESMDYNDIIKYADCGIKSEK